MTDSLRALAERLRADADAVEKVSPDVGFHQAEPFGTGRFTRGQGSPALLTTAADLREAAAAILGLLDERGTAAVSFAHLAATSTAAYTTLRSERDRMAKVVEAARLLGTTDEDGYVIRKIEAALAALSSPEKPTPEEKG